MPLLRVVNTGPVCGCAKRYGSLGSWPGWEDTQVATRRASGRKSSRRLPSNNACMQPEQDTLTWVRREGAQQPGQGQAVAHMDGVLQPVVAAVRPQLVRLLRLLRLVGHVSRSAKARLSCALIQRGSPCHLWLRSRKPHAHVSPRTRAVRRLATQHCGVRVLRQHAFASVGTQPKRVTPLLSEAPRACDACRGHLTPRRHHGVCHRALGAHWVRCLRCKRLQQAASVCTLLTAWARLAVCASLQVEVGQVPGAVQGY